MLKLTVKTMDSRSRSYTVADQTTIRDFKQTISGEVDISPDRQRLIYQGRVLSDDFKLNKEHDGKVLHLVQRIPISATTVASSTTPTSSTTTQSQPTQNQNPNIFPSNHLAQVFQQALGSLGNVMSGGNGGAPVISGTMLSTDGTGGADQAMNFHIEVGPTTIHTPAPQPTATSSSSSSTPNPVTSFSAPRQMLDRVKHMLFHLNEALTELENESDSMDGVTPSGSNLPGDGSSTEVVCASENDPEAAAAPESEPSAATNSTPTTTTTSSTSTSSQPRNTHPTLKEVGKVYKDVIKADERLIPHLEYMSEFLEKDPFFRSTECEEFQTTSRRMSVILKAQRLLSHIHGALSNMAIPLGRTPPRSMLVRAQTPVQPGRRHGVPLHPPPAMGPGGPRAHHQAGPMPWLGIATQPGQRPGQVPPPQIRMVRMSAPIGPGGFQGPLLPFPHPGIPIPSPQATPVVRPSTQPARSAQAQASPAVAASQRPPVPVTAAAQSSQSRPVSTPASAPVATAISTPPSGQEISVEPLRYNIEVNASIQPYIHISVNNDREQQPPSSTSQPVSPPTTVNISRNEVDFSTLPPFEPTVSEPQQTRSQASGPIPGLPTVTGPNAENLRSFVLYHAQRRILEGMEQSSGSRTTNDQTENRPAGHDQIAEDVSSIVSQAVNDAMYNHLSGASAQPIAISSDTAGPPPDESEHPPGTKTTLRPKPTSTQSSALRASTSTTPSKQTVVKSSPKEESASSKATTSSPTPMSVDETLQGENKGDGDAEKGKKLSPSGLKKIINDGGFGSKNSPNSSARPHTPASSEEREIDPKEMMEIINDEIRTRGILESPPVAIPPKTVQEKARDIIGEITYDMPVPLGTTVSMNDLARQMGYDFPSLDHPRAHLPEKIMILIGEQVTNDEVYEYFQGNVAPLDKIRDTLREFLSKEFFNGCTPTRDDIKMATEIFSESYRPTLVRFFSPAKSTPLYDLVESNLALHRHFVQRAMDRIFFADDDDFSKSLNYQIRFTFAAWVKLNEYLLDGHRMDFAKLLLLTDDINKKRRDPLTILCLGMLRPDDRKTHPLLLMLEALSNFMNVTSDEMKQFLVPCKKYVDNMVPLTDIIVGKNGEISVKSKSGDVSVLAKKDASKSSTSKDVPSTSSADTQWKNEVPKDWVDTIVGDIEKQKTMPPQQPFSEAYLAGMPASKRRKIVS